MQAGFQCAGCGEWNETTVDESAGSSQSYVEDCQVCCKPNLLAIHHDRERDVFVITAELEDS
jgi:Cysteine-rich CPXCG